VDAGQAPSHLSLEPTRLSPLEIGGHTRFPLHRSRFDIRTGEVKRWANFPPGIQMLNIVRGENALQTYPTVVKDGVVYVEI
jgi:nitrite reductase/ring-hydroxylating ferredoxin subunit